MRGQWLRSKNFCSFFDGIIVAFSYAYIQFLGRLGDVTESRAQVTGRFNLSNCKLLAISQKFLAADCSDGFPSLHRHRTIQLQSISNFALPFLLLSMSKPSTREAKKNNYSWSRTFSSNIQHSATQLFQQNLVILYRCMSLISTEPLASVCIIQKINMKIIMLLVGLLFRVCVSKR